MSVFLKTEDLARKYGVSHFAIKQAIRASKGSEVVVYRPDRQGGYFIAPEDEEKITRLLLNPHKARKRTKKKSAETADDIKTTDEPTTLQGGNVAQMK